MTIMSIRNKLKTILPAYRTERILEARIAELNKNVRETNEKNEYLFWLSQMQPGETMQQTKERVFLQMPKATGRLRKIQLAENYILRRVKDVCDENGLELFLVGGTLLGAVRHRGFIPWDNDVDVGMMKQDYLKLREILAKDPELSLEYYYNYKAGLRMSKVKFRAVEVFWIDILFGSYADIVERIADRIYAMLFHEQIRFASVGQIRAAAADMLAGDRAAVIRKSSGELYRRLEKKQYFRVWCRQAKKRFRHWAAIRVKYRRSGKECR